MSILPEDRRRRLRILLSRKSCLRIMEASCGLMGMIVENVRWEEKVFDGIWVSSLCDSAWRGRPDNEFVDFSERLHTIREIMEVTTKPIILDGDTGGRMEHFTEHVRTLERMGVSGIVIEDKSGLKQNSLLDGEVNQILEEKEIFSEKIKKGKEALLTKDFMIIARIESFIAGKDVVDAMERARCYVTAGADGIMIHSKKKEGTEIREFLELFREEYPDIVTIVVPTAYDSLREKELEDMGAGVIIYANHMLRSAYQAMLQTAECILKEERGMEAGNLFCASVEDILQITGERKND